MNYNRLETSLIDVIKEEQAKLGYMKEKISLYFRSVLLLFLVNILSDIA